MTTRFLVVCFLSFTLFVLPALGQHAQRLPAETVGCFSILNFKRWQTEFRDSDIGSYFNDPAVATMYKEITQAALKENEFLAIIQSAILREFATGQLTLAIVDRNKSLEVAMIVECQDGQSAQRCAEAILSNKDANQSFEVSFDERTVFASSDPLILKQLLKPEAKPLSTMPSFRETVVKSATDVKGPLFWVFVDPLAFADLVAMENKAKNGDVLQTARQEGFDAIKAIGGTGKLGTAGRSTNLIGYIAAQPPYRRGMRMLKLSNTNVPPMPHWASSASSSGYINFQFQTILTSFSTIFDALVGDGEDGVFDAVLDDLKNDPKGPELDIQRDIIDQLESPLFFATDDLDNKNRTVVGIQIRDYDRLKDSLVRFYEGDSQAITIESPSFVAWKIQPLNNVESGIRNEYVVALNNEFLLIADDMRAINVAFRKNRSVSSWKTARSNEWVNSASSFGYQLDLATLVEKKHGQLKNATVDGWLGDWFERLQLTNALKNANRSQWPDYSSVEKKFESQLRLLGHSNSGGWKFVVEIQ